MENWKDIAMEEDWASKARLVPFLSMGWETSMPNVMLEFLNTLLIKDAYIYFGHKDKMYVINKKLIVDVFGVRAKGYVEELKGQVSKFVMTLALWKPYGVPNLQRSISGVKTHLIKDFLTPLEYFET